MTLNDRVLGTIRRHALLPHGARVVAAVSGGADSVALVLVLARMAPAHGFTLAGIAHLNHGLRAAASDADETFVAALATRLGVPFVAAREDVAARAREAGESIEAAARRARYAFLDGAAAGLAATHIATGHTADDQAETLLLRLMRGAGLSGLSGIRPRNGIVVRPLLDARRADVETFLREAGEVWREDASNVDRAIVRNRVRHDVIPVLKDAAGPGIVDALARTAALIQEDAEELERQAIELAARTVSRDGTGVSLEIAPLQSAGPALARRVIRAALVETAGGRFQTLEHVEAVRSLMKDESPSRAQLPGVMATRARGAIRLEWDAQAGAASAPSAFEMPLRVPGIAHVAHSALIVSAEVGSLGAKELNAMSARADTVAVQGVQGLELTVRSRRPGDALRPFGAPGRRKLQDLFVDRKIARAERDRVPLVVDDRGRIIWVVGHTIADEFRVTAPEASVLLLKVRQAGTRSGESGGSV